MELPISGLGAANAQRAGGGMDSFHGAGASEKGSEIFSIAKMVGITGSAVENMQDDLSMSGVSNKNGRNAGPKM